MKKIHQLFTVFLTLIFTVSVLPLQQAKAFTDVPLESWIYPYVVDLLNEGVIDSADKYRPDDKMNRAELVKVVIIASGEAGKEVLPEYPTFDDAPVGVWFFPYVERAATLGIVSGYSDPDGNLTGRFGSADPVTRAQAVKILIEGFKLTTSTPGTRTFSDVLNTDWFYNYINTATALGLAEGYEGDIFKPNQSVTRAEMAKMLSIALTVWKNENNPDPEKPEDETPDNGIEDPDDETPDVDNPSDEPDTDTPEDQVAFKPNANALSPSVLVADDGQKFVGRYNFEGQLEGFTVSTLTLVNDLTGDTLGDDPESNLMIKTITLKYPDKKGFLKTATRPLDSEGTARFSNLDFFVKKGQETPLEIYVDLNSFSKIGAQGSGEAFRLGLQNTNNTFTTFSAAGEFSGDTLTLGDAGLNLSNSGVDPFTVRKTAPKFELITPSGTLLSGTNKLIGLKVTADKNASLALGRLVFNISVDDEDNANLTLNDFQWFKDAELIEEAQIFDATGAQDLSSNGGGTLTDGSYQVIVSFDEEQVISAGSTRTYYLKANVTGEDDDDSITTSLEEGDDNSPLTGLTDVNQQNTGKIFVNGDSTAGIFTGAEEDFSQLIDTDRNILWSDLSFSPHQYPQVTGGSVTTDTGSADWTNGYGLKIGTLANSVLTK